MEVVEVEVAVVVTLSGGRGWCWRCRQINLIKARAPPAPPWTALRSPRTEMSVCSHYVEFILPLLSKQPNIRLLRAQSSWERLSTVVVVQLIKYPVYFHKNCHQTTGYCRLLLVASRNVRIAFSFSRCFEGEARWDNVVSSTQVLRR